MPDGLEQFSLPQLAALRVQAANDTAMAARIDAAREAKGWERGQPVPGFPGLTQRIEPPSPENGWRNGVTRFEDDGSGKGMLAWLSPFMTDGASCKLDRNMVQEERRGGRVEQVFVPRGKRAAAV